MENPVAIAANSQNPVRANNDQAHLLPRGTRIYASKQVDIHPLLDRSVSLDYLLINTDRWNGLETVPIREAIARMHGGCGRDCELIMNTTRVSTHNPIQGLRQRLETVLKAKIEGLPLPALPSRAEILAHGYCHPKDEIDGRIASLLAPLRLGHLLSVETYHEMTERTNAPASDVTTPQAERIAEPEDELQRLETKWQAVWVLSSKTNSRLPRTQQSIDKAKQESATALVHELAKLNSRVDDNIRSIESATEQVKAMQTMITTIRIRKSRCPTYQRARGMAEAGIPRARLEQHRHRRRGATKQARWGGVVKTGGLDGQDATGSNHGLQPYQLMLHNQQNRKRLMMARQKQGLVTISNTLRMVGVP
ncbi:hypothetical protein N657DRAFT_632727 [Parathielavia appendiculata]|uniref:Uncharacterized protein n=1 Tax=Parathielavia appendiculata TaxID=2587402 RepID=A0AAN6U1M9_9PEZI|nr:hypothetical protein N657DRAFT_632727 [Parathielavia appendiculata]